MVSFSLSSVMLNATVDNNDIIGQVVDDKYCVMHQLNDLQVLCLQITPMKISVTITAGNVKIQRYILFCRIFKSAEQSQHQLLVPTTKKVYVRFSRHPISNSITNP
jgi:hypothetical protein